MFNLKAKYFFSYKTLLLNPQPFPEKLKVIFNKINHFEHRNHFSEMIRERSLRYL